MGDHILVSVHIDLDLSHSKVFAQFDQSSLCQEVTWFGSVQKVDIEICSERQVNDANAG